MRQTAIEAHLGKAELAALRRGAKSLGMSPEDFARQLIEAGLLLEQRARTESFDQLFAGVRRDFRKSGMKEQELNRLVDGARFRHQQRSSRKKR
jgi:hypothetical protein